MEIYYSATVTHVSETFNGICLIFAAGGTCSTALSLNVSICWYFGDLLNSFDLFGNVNQDNLPWKMSPFLSCMSVFKLWVNPKALGFKAGLTLQLSMLHTWWAKCCHNWIKSSFKDKMDNAWVKNAQRDAQHRVLHLPVLPVMSVVFCSGHRLG